MLKVGGWGAIAPHGSYAYAMVHALTCDSRTQLPRPSPITPRIVDPARMRKDKAMRVQGLVRRVHIPEYSITYC